MKNIFMLLLARPQALPPNVEKPGEQLVLVEEEEEEENLSG